jgi:hypothetical protein
MLPASRKSCSPDRSGAVALLLQPDDYAEIQLVGSRTRARWLTGLLGALRSDHEISPATWRALGLLGYAHVRQRRAGGAPSDEASHAYWVALAANLPIRRVMQECGRVLASVGVHAIVYKGQDYLDRIYGDLGARPMADVDLLVRPAELALAEAALGAAGFVLDDAFPTMHERKWVKNGVAVDLHEAFMHEGRASIDLAEVFARALPCATAPGLHVLEATDALLVHCVAQAVKAYRVPASSYLELQALFDAADADAALTRAKRFRICSALYASSRVLGALGHERARALLECVPLSRPRRVCLDALAASVALLGTSRLPRSLSLLVSKAVLIDDMRRAAVFVGKWFVFQLAGLRRPRRPASRAQVVRAA